MLLIFLMLQHIRVVILLPAGYFARADDKQRRMTSGRCDVTTSQSDVTITNKPTLSLDSDDVTPSYPVSETISVTEGELQRESPPYTQSVVCADVN